MRAKCVVGRIILKLFVRPQRTAVINFRDGHECQNMSISNRGIIFLIQNLNNNNTHIFLYFYITIYINIIMDNLSNIYLFIT